MIHPLLLSHFADLSRIGAAALIAAIWQGALLAAAAALVLRLVPRITAAARFAIWFAVFTLIAALPLLHVAPPTGVSIAGNHPSHAWFSFDSRWTLFIAAIWAAASLFRAAMLIAAALRVRTLSRSAMPIEPELSTATYTASSRLAQLCSSADVDRPTVIGFFSPKILIPAWLLDRLTPPEIEHVILHESGHLNRADDWLNLLQKLALVIFPLNPALAWVEHRLCFERELACDERVLSALAMRAEEFAPASYASSLATLAEYRLQRRGVTGSLVLALGALGASARQSELGRRVARILRPVVHMKPLHVRLATAGAIAALLFTATELEHTPQLISFASPAPAAQLSGMTTSPDTGMKSGAYATVVGQHRVGSMNVSYHAVATSLTLPSALQSKSVDDKATRLSTRLHASTGPRAIAVSSTPEKERSQRQISARMTSTPQSEQSDLVVARYTVTTWQSADGYRVVRTSAAFSTAQPVTSPAQQDASLNSSAASAPRTQQIPYAAVPVPGGWLVFQL